MSKIVVEGMIHDGSWVTLAEVDGDANDCIYIRNLIFRAEGNEAVKASNTIIYPGKFLAINVEMV